MLKARFTRTELRTARVHENEGDTATRRRVSYPRFENVLPDFKELWYTGHYVATEDKEYGVAVEVPNPYCSEEQFNEHPFWYSPLEAFACVEDGFADAVSTQTMFGTTVKPVFFLDEEKGRLARQRFLEGLGKDIFPLDRDNLFYLLAVGVGFSTRYVRAPDPTDKFYYGEDPDHPHNFLGGGFREAMQFSSEEAAEKLYDDVFKAYDLKNPPRKESGESGYAQGRHTELWSLKLLNFHIKLEQEEKEVRSILFSLQNASYSLKDYDLETREMLRNKRPQSDLSEKEIELLDKYVKDWRSNYGFLSE